MNEFLNYMRVNGFSSNTIESYKKDLISFFESFKTPPSDVNEIRKYIRHLYDKKYSASTISRHISTLKSFYNYLEENGTIKNNPMVLISNPKKEKLLPNYLNYEAVERLLNTPDVKTKKGLRDALILEMLYSSGIRVSELVNIKIKDINFSERKILILGKGRKERFVFYGTKAYTLLNEYLKNHKDEYLFTNTKGNKLNDRMVREIVSSNAKIAHIDVKVTPHTLRHTYATHMLEGGADLKSVGDLLGHENLSTTGIYTHVSNERLRNVYLNTHPRAKATWKNK